MERKAPLPPLFWNKNAPKAPNGGVSRVGYQLVRMRSPFPSLKDMETGTAPTRTLSNTSASNTAQKRETGGRNPAPCFFMPFNAFRPPASSPCPAGHTSDAIPTGTPPQGFASPSAGDCMGRNQPLAPPYARGAATAQFSPVAGRPVPMSNQPLIKQQKAHQFP